MKAKTFENLIRKIIREEIDYSLRRELKSLKEDLREEIKPVITEHKSKLVEVPNKIPETTTNSLKEKIMGGTNFKPKTFAKDNTLNELLNETAMGGTNTESGNAPMALPDQPFSSPNPIQTEEMPTQVQDAVTRDYSDLMKAIEKKKGR